MSNRLAIGAGIARGLRDATQTMLQVTLAKERIQQSRERFDLDKKIADLRMKKLEQELDPETARITKELQKRDLDLKEAALSLAEVQNQSAKELATKRKRELDNMGRLYVLAGLEPLENMPGMTPGQVKDAKSADLGTIPEGGGGTVMGPVGSRMVDSEEEGGGFILDAQGKKIGSYEAGYRPGTSDEPFLDKLRKDVGVTKQSAAQEALGITTRKPDLRVMLNPETNREEYFQYDATTKTYKPTGMARKAEKDEGDEKPSAAERKMIGDIRFWIDSGFSRSDIEREIRLSGFSPEDFEDELSYAEEKTTPGWLKAIAGFANKVNPMAIGDIGRSDAGEGDRYDDKTEADIAENMRYYGQSREKVIEAMKRKGMIQ